MSRKTILRAFALILITMLVLPITTVNASEYNSDQSVYIHDHAGLLTATEEDELKELAEYFCKDWNLNVLFLTTNNTNGKSTLTYSDDYMDDLFPVGVENNIAFIIDMDNRQYYINTMGIAISQLSNYEIDIALDKAFGAMKAGNYGRAMEKMATYCLSNITGKSAMMAGGLLSGIIAFMLSGALWALIPTAIVVVVLISKHNAANKQQTATRYMSSENYTIIDKDEIFVRSYDTVQHNYYKPKSSSSGSGGGSSHRSSSGRSHGGGGRSF